MAGEAWADAQNTIVEAGGFLRIVPLNASEDNEFEIASLGTKADFLKTTEEIDIYSNLQSGETEYKYKKLANGTVLRVEKIAPMIDAASGQIVSKDENSFDSFIISALVGKTLKDLLVDWIRNKKTLAACVSLGINALRENIGFAYLICRINGDLKESRKDELSNVAFTLKGGSVFTINETTPGTPDIVYGDYNGIAAGSGNPIEPVGKSQFVIKELSSSEWSALFSGKIIRTDNS